MDKKKDNKETKQKKKTSNKLSNNDKKEIERLQLINKDLTKKIETLTESEEKAKKDSLLHMAELENFKKRKAQEVDTFKKYAAENVISAFLPVPFLLIIAALRPSWTLSQISFFKTGFTFLGKLSTKTKWQLGDLPLVANKLT